MFLENKVLCRCLCLSGASGEAAECPALLQESGVWGAWGLPEWYKNVDIFVNSKMECVYFYQGGMLFNLTLCNTED